jgi:hypothetical protein
MATAWAVAQNRAAERLGGEVEASRSATIPAERAQAEANEALVAAADAAGDAAEADRDRLAVEVIEVRAVADRAAGQRAAAEAERDRLLTELSQVRQAIAESERHTTAAGAARVASELAAKQAQEAAEAMRHAPGGRSGSASRGGRSRNGPRATRMRRWRPPPPLYVRRKPRLRRPGVP